MSNTGRGVLCKIFPVKAKVNDKAVRLLVNEQLFMLRCSSQSQSTFDLQLLKWSSSVCCTGNPTEYRPAVEAED